MHPIKSLLKLMLSQIIAGSLAIAAFPTCTVLPGSVASLRSGGLTEMVADILLKCEGGTPTPEGTPVPAVAIQLMMPGSTVTSRLLAGDWTEALLTISDDGAEPATPLACGAPGAVQTSPGMCEVLGTGTGQGVYDGSPGRPNVFQARLPANPVLPPSSRNVLLWPGIPIDGGTHYIRLTRVRVTVPVVPSMGAPTSIFGLVVGTPASFPIVNPTQQVGIVLPSLFVATDNVPRLRRCTGENTALAADPTASGTPQFKITLREMFPTAFMTRTAAAFVDDDTSPDPAGGMWTSHPAETAHLDLSLPYIAGQGDLATAGLADHGTRLFARFINVPPGVQLFAPVVVPLTAGSPSGVLRMVAPNLLSGGAFEPVQGNVNGLAKLTSLSGVPTLVYEVLDGSINNDTAEAPIYVAYLPNEPPFAGLVQFIAGLGPVSIENFASETGPIPRFFGGDYQSDAFRLDSCAANFDGNTAPDVVWQNDTTRQVTVNYFGGTGGASLTGWNWLNSSGAQGWSVVAAADFDGNGVPDLVWQNETTRQVTVNYYGGSQGASLTGWNWLNATGAPGWRVVAAADFDGNSVPDLVWQNAATRQVTVNYYGGAQGATLTGWNWLQPYAVPGWMVVGAADFDGNGVPDLVWQNEATRQVTVNYFGGPQGASLTGWNWLNDCGAPGWKVVALADFDGNGVPDLVWQNDTTRQVTLNYYGGAQGASLQGWSWLYSMGFPGWTLAAAQ